ncbi:NUDIX domain-containing protein [Arsenicicoccus dermatophilus]|uniref:NUDIX domain-containing protein n=1 Tax=Arsenicicoccus dermatophilus TaxID=1076331 RepID=UPI003916FF5F
MSSHPATQVKAMLVTLSPDGSTHLVSHHPPTQENPLGFHRLVGGSVEPGETHREAVIREVHEELGARIEDLTSLDVLESIFMVDGRQGHEIVLVHAGRLDPAPPQTGGRLTEIDGSVLPVVWRPVADADQPIPLYPLSSPISPRESGTAVVAVPEVTSWNG